MVQAPHIRSHSLTFAHIRSHSLTFAHIRRNRSLAFVRRDHHRHGWSKPLATSSNRSHSLTFALNRLSIAHSPSSPPTNPYPPTSLANTTPYPALPDSPTASEKAKERGADPTLFLVTVAAERSLKDFIHRKADYKDSFSFKYTQRAGQALRMARIQKWGRQVLLAVVALQKKGLPVLHLHCGNVLLRKGGAAALAEYENVLFGFDMEQRTGTVVIPHLAAGKDVAVVQFGALLWEMATGVELDTCLPSRDVELDPTIRGIIDLIFGRHHPDVAIKGKGDAAAARAGGGSGGGGGGDGGSGEGGDGEGGSEGTGSAADGGGEGKAGGGEEEEEEEGEDEEDPLSIDELLDMPFFAPLLLKSGGSAERDIPKLRFDSQMKGVVKTAAREATERVGRLVEEYRNSINQRRREEERVRQAIKDDTEALSGKAKNTQQAQRASRRASVTRYKSNRSSRRGSTTSKGATGTTSGARDGADSNSVETAATVAAPPPPAQKTTAAPSAPPGPPAPPAAPPAAPAAPPAAPAAPPAATAAPAAPPAAKAKAKKRPPLGGGGGGGGMSGGLLAAIQSGKSLKKAPPPKDKDDDDDDGGSGGRGGGGPGGMLGEMMARQRAMKKG